MDQNKRDYVRIEMTSKVFIEVAAATDESASELRECKVLDVSYGGFRVVRDIALTEGAILSISAELPAFPDPFYMAAEVAWCIPRERSSQGWFAGFELLNSKDTDINSWREVLEHI